MNQPGLGIVILLLSSAFISVFFHRSNRSFLKACALSGILASLVLQVVDVIHRGYPDKFFLIAILFGTLWAGLASAAVGGILRVLGYHSVPAVERANEGNGPSNGEA